MVRGQRDQSRYKPERRKEKVSNQPSDKSRYRLKRRKLQQSKRGCQRYRNRRKEQCSNQQSDRRRGASSVQEKGRGAQRMERTELRKEHMWQCALRVLSCFVIFL